VIVVSDSSPLVILAKLQQFESLQKLFGRIFISRDVFHEVVVAGTGLPGAAELRTATWIEVKESEHSDSMHPAQTKSNLGAGEMSSIRLAHDMNADRLLLDDYKARRVAIEQGIRVLGTVGLLEAFHSRGYLSDLTEAFRQLILERAYIDERLLNRRLRALGLKRL
jgi:uncharacterized protein